MLSFTSAVWLFVLALGVAQAQEEVSTEITPCDDWEKDAAAYQEAFAKWQEPLCYKFTYSSIASGFDSTPVVRTVLNGTPPDAELTSGYYYFNTLTDVWKWIEEQCFLYCPTSGVLACEIQYATTEESGLVYPSSFKIDPDDKVDGDEVSLRIEDVVAFDCLSSSAYNESVKLCEEWEIRAATFDEALAKFNKWPEPPCYAFMYSDLNWGDGVPTLQTVQNGTSVGNEYDGSVSTLQDAWNKIGEECFQTCTAWGRWSYMCDVEYATENETNVIYPAFFKLGESIYEIKNVHALNCSEIVEGPGDDGSSYNDDPYAQKNPCLDWETNIPAYNKAFAKWKEPECYTLTYVDHAHHSTRQPVVQTVRNGTARHVIDDVMFLSFYTLTDFWDEIDEFCVRDCPTRGAHYCQIEYTTDDESGIIYPSLLSIDYWEDGFDDEVEYVISYSPCGGRKAGVCADFEEFQNTFYSAMLGISYDIEMFGCYTYTIERQGSVSEELRGPFQVVVQDGEPKLVSGPSTSIGTNMALTLSGWMARIEKNCITGCASNSSLEAYYNCTVEYDPTWYIPMHIVLDVDGATVGDEYEYMVSDFIFGTCDAVHSDVVTGTKPPSEVTHVKPTSAFVSSPATVVTAYIGAIAVGITTVIFCYY